MLKICREESGISLTEVLVFALLLTLVLAAVYSLLASGIGSWGRGETAIELQQNARLAMDRMIREIRIAHKIVNARVIRDGNEIKFPTTVEEISFIKDDSNGDGVYNVTNDKILGYRIGGSSGATLVRRVLNPGETVAVSNPLAEYVEELNFRFFGANSVEIPPTTDISLTNYYDNVTCVEINIVVSKDDMRKQLTSKVRLRNR